MTLAEGPGLRGCKCAKKLEEGVTWPWYMGHTASHGWLVCMRLKPKAAPKTAASAKPKAVKKPVANKAGKRK